MRVEIDEHSGFCFGVVNAIRKAEQELERGMLYCIGDIVHNDLEVERLRLRGLKTIEHEQFARLQHCRVLFRAHGEPPVSYEIAQKNEVEVIDASCPVVLNLQKRIRKAYEQTREQGGQVVIYGKRGHAEVVGLVGQTNGEALVIENPEDIRQIDFSRPVILFSQTTKSLEGFQAIAALLKEKGGAQVVVNDTICRKVANRIPQLREFAQKHDNKRRIDFRPSTTKPFLKELKTIRLWVPKTNNSLIRKKYITSFIESVHKNKNYIYKGKTEPSWVWFPKI